MNENVTTEDIEEYYTECHPAYNKRWSLDSHPSTIHIGYYDDEHTSFGEAAERMKEKLAEAVDVGPDDRVLDAGCGLGETTTWIASERGADVVGINITRKQLEHGRELARERGIDDEVTFRYDDFTEMETVEDDSVDVVWGLESMCYAEDKRDVLEQAARVLKPGGRIVVADGFMTERNLAPGDREVVRKWLDGWEIPNFAHREDFLADLEDLGFDDVEYEDAKENVMPMAKNLYRISFVSYPIARIKQVLGLSGDALAGNFRGCRYQYRAFQRDLTTYAIVSARL